jgi:hypothetical protein
MDKNLKAKIGILHQKRIDGFFDAAFVVVSEAANANRDIFLQSHQLSKLKLILLTE